MKRKHWVMLGAGAMIVAVIVAGLTLWGLWLLIESLDTGAVRLWAILATLALVPTFFIGWRLGQLYSSGVLTGLGLGINQVSSAAAKLRVRESRPASTNIAVLPALPSVQHRQLPGGESEVIDL